MPRHDAHDAAIFDSSPAAMRVTRKMRQRDARAWRAAARGAEFRAFVAALDCRHAAVALQTRACRNDCCQRYARGRVQKSHALREAHVKRKEKDEARHGTERGMICAMTGTRCREAAQPYAPVLLQVTHATPCARTYERTVRSIYARRLPPRGRRRCAQGKMQCARCAGAAVLCARRRCSSAHVAASRGASCRARVRDDALLPTIWFTCF